MSNARNDQEIGNAEALQGQTFAAGKPPVDPYQTIESINSNRPASENSEVDDARPLMAAEPLQLKAGTKIDDYQLISLVAQGGMGMVFRARQVSLDRVVALKMILGGSMARDKDIERFRIEAKAAAALDHPHIVPIYEFGEYKGNCYFTMALVDGIGLDRLAETETLTPQDATRIVETLARAVHHAHERGIVHRDLKPANVLMDRDGRPRITDFGLAKQLHSDTHLTSTGQVMGTPSYMSPEQALTYPNASQPSVDVYALGGILYFLLTRRPPFEGNSVTDTLIKVATLKPTAPSVHNPLVPPELENICLRCLEKEPGNRYPTAFDLANVLRDWQGGKSADSLETQNHLPSQAASSATQWSSSSLRPNISPANPDTVVDKHSGGAKRELENTRNTTANAHPMVASSERVLLSWTSWPVLGGIVAVVLVCVTLGMWLAGPPKNNHDAKTPTAPQNEKDSARAKNTEHEAINEVDILPPLPPDPKPMLDQLKERIKSKEPFLPRFPFPPPPKP